MISIKKHNKSLKLIRKRKSLKLIRKRKSLNHKKIIGGQVLFDKENIKDFIKHPLGTHEDSIYNCLAYVFLLLQYADLEACRELGQIKSKYKFIGVTQRLLLVLLEDYGHSEFINIILYDQKYTPQPMGGGEVAKKMFENLSILPMGHATLACINVINRSNGLSHYFAIMRTEHTFLAIDPQVDVVCPIGEYLLKHTGVLSAEYYNIRILISDIDRASHKVTLHKVIHTLTLPQVNELNNPSWLIILPNAPFNNAGRANARRDNTVSAEIAQQIFPETITHEKILEMPEIPEIPELQGWNERRAVFGLPPLRYRPERLSEAAATE